MDRCVLLNWFIDCFIHWERNCTWYQSTYIYTVNEPIQQHTALDYFSWLRWTAMKLCVLDMKVYIYIYTFISRTVPFSVYKTVNEPIHQHTAVHYNSWLRWTALNLRLQQNVTHFFSSDLRSPFRGQVQFVCRGCFLRAFSWVCIYKHTHICRDL